jgi:flagellar protein FliS
MLFEGALERLASAKGHLQRNEIASKGEQIGKAINIIGGLHDSLNLEAGGELARNLDVLYDYMQRRLLQANQKSDPAVLDEVAGLLRELKAGWDAIAS